MKHKSPKELGRSLLQQLPKLPKTLLPILKEGKNLLAFSGGVDSSALFFTLLQNQIPFEVAHVNYQTRKQSDIETTHINNLCKKHNIPCHIYTCKLSKSNFEHNARKIRYSFFARILRQRELKVLLSAHQLNDRLEWLLMRLLQGAGTMSLAGFSQREIWKDWELIRPFSDVTKKSLKEFLDCNKLPYFIDESNSDFSYLRNQIRHTFSDPLLQLGEKGIRDSLHFLELDAKILQGPKPKKIHNLWLIDRANTPSIVGVIDKILKQEGLLMSQGERKSITCKDGVIRNKFAIGWHKEFVGIAPYTQTAMTKEFKEACRKAKIPPLLRPYMYKKSINPDLLTHML
jgi:tRNA(Ile)-lysidine synthase